MGTAAAVQQGVSASVVDEKKVISSGKRLFLVNGDCRVTRNELAIISNRSWRAVRHYDESGVLKRLESLGNKVEYSLMDSLAALKMPDLAQALKLKRVIQLPPDEPMRKRRKVSNVVHLKSLKV